MASDSHLCCNPRVTLAQERLAWFHEQLRLAQEELAELEVRSDFGDHDAGVEQVDWSKFNWQHDCMMIHEGTMKVVGQLKRYPHIALVSVQNGTGAWELEKEMKVLCELADEHNIRTVPFSRKVLDVPHYNVNDEEATAKAYLQYYFNRDMCFLFKEGEPGTEHYYEDSMRKLKICQEDEGSWEFNGDTIRILNEHNLQKEFMEDLTNYVKLLAKKRRVVDLQGMLGLDGHFYIADPLDLWATNSEVSQYFLDGVYKHPRSRPRKYKEYAELGVYFVEGLDLDLGVLVPEDGLARACKL